MTPLLYLISQYGAILLTAVKLRHIFLCTSLLPGIKPLSAIRESAWLNSLLFLAFICWRGWRSSGDNASNGTLEETWFLYVNVMHWNLALNSQVGGRNRFWEFDNSPFSHMYALYMWGSIIVRIIVKTNYPTDPGFLDPKYCWRTIWHSNMPVSSCIAFKGLDQRKQSSGWEMEGLCSVVLRGPF